MGSGVMRYSPWPFVALAVRQVGHFFELQNRTACLDGHAWQDGAAFVSDLARNCRQLLGFGWVGRRQTKEGANEREQREHA
jgi:hypothetical protein